MSERDKMPPKAYKNLAFLSSPDARTLRILAEYLEPQQRFWEEGVRDTVVFFGSARIRSKKQAQRRLREVQKKLDNVKRKSAKLNREYELAQGGLTLSRYYEDAVELSRMMTEWSLALSDERRFVVCSGGGLVLWKLQTKAHQKRVALLLV